MPRPEPMLLPGGRRLVDESARQVLGHVEKNRRELILLSLTNWHGEEFADLRVYVVNEVGLYVPTRKGLTVRPAVALELHEALTAARSALEEAVRATA